MNRTIPYAVPSDQSPESWGIPSSSNLNSPAGTAGDSSPSTGTTTGTTARDCTTEQFQKGGNITTHQQQERQQQGQTQDSILPSAPLCFSSRLVGRQFQKGSKAVKLRPGDRLAVQPEPSNPRDKNSLLVIAPEPLSNNSKHRRPDVSSGEPTTSTSVGHKFSAATLGKTSIGAAANSEGVPLGHLPAAVAQHLSPILQKGIAIAEAVVIEGPSGDKSHVLLEIQVISTICTVGSCSTAGMSEKAAAAAIRRAVSAAGAAAGGTGSGATAGGGNGTGSGNGTGGFSGEATGERLRRNFATVVTTVRTHDASLLAEDELNFLHAYESVSAPAQCLFLRLSQRCGPTFRLKTLSYSDVPYPVGAAMELERAGLLQCIALPGMAITPQSVGIVTGTAVETSTNDHLKRSIVSNSNQNQSNTELMSGSRGNSDSQASYKWEDVAGVLTVVELQGILSKLIAPQAPQGPSGNIPGPSVNAAAAKKKSPNSLVPSTRPTVLAALQRRAESGHIAQRNAVFQELLFSSGPLARIPGSICTVLDRIQRLFFLNEGLSLGQFLATDVGAVRYPSYTLTRTHPVFPTRDHLLRYEIALHQAEVLSAALEEGDWEAAEAAVAPAWAALDDGEHKELKGGMGGGGGGGGGSPVVIDLSIDEEEHLPEENPVEDAGPAATINNNNDGNTNSKVPLFLRRYNAAWVYCMMATAGVSVLERQKRYREAADRLHQLLGGWCCPGRRGLWWLRLSTDLEHLNRQTDALEIAEAALADEWLSSGDRLALQRRVLRLGKPPRRWRRPPWAAAAQREPREVRIEGRPLTNTIGIKSRFYGYDGEQCTVEELALQHYASPLGGEYRGVHTEGGVWATLFSLLMWPVLFSLSIPDAFRTPFQTAPLDLDSDGFYAAREGEIEAQLADIAAGAAPAMLASVWAEHHGTMCRGVRWDRFTLEELQEVAECVGGSGLAAVCRLLAQDHSGWQGGMPDLLLWHPEKGIAKLSEVKGPRDRLSDQQRAWIAALEDAGLVVEVLKVVEPKGGTAGGGKGKGQGN